MQTQTCLLPRELRRSCDMVYSSARLSKCPPFCSSWNWWHFSYGKDRHYEV